MWHYNIVHENANIIQTSEIVKVIQKKYLTKYAPFSGVNCFFLSELWSLSKKNTYFCIYETF